MAYKSIFNKQENPQAPTPPKPQPAGSGSRYRSVFPTTPPSATSGSSQGSQPAPTYQPVFQTSPKPDSEIVTPTPEPTQPAQVSLRESAWKAFAKTLPTTLFGSVGGALSSIFSRQIDQVVERSLKNEPLIDQKQKQNVNTALNFLQIPQERFWGIVDTAKKSTGNLLLGVEQLPTTLQERLASAGQMTPRLITFLQDPTGFASELGQEQLDKQFPQYKGEFDIRQRSVSHYLIDTITTPVIDRAAKIIRDNAQARRDRNPQWNEPTYFSQKKGWDGFVENITKHPAEYLSWEAGRVVPDVASQIGIAMLTGQWASLGFMGLAAGGETYQDAIEKGVPENQASALGFIRGGIETSLEKFGFDFLLDKSPVSTKILDNISNNTLRALTKTAVNTTGEATTETIQDAFADAIAHTFDPNHENADYFRTFISSFIGSSPFTAATSMSSDKSAADLATDGMLNQDRQSTTPRPNEPKESSLPTMPKTPTPPPAYKITPKKTEIVLFNPLVRQSPEGMQFPQAANFVQETTEQVRTQAEKYVTSRGNATVSAREGAVKVLDLRTVSKRDAKSIQKMRTESAEVVLPKVEGQGFDIVIDRQGRIAANDAGQAAMGNVYEDTQASRRQPLPDKLDNYLTKFKNFSALTGSRSQLAKELSEIGVEMPTEFIAKNIEAQGDVSPELVQKVMAEATQKSISEIKPFEVKIQNGRLVVSGDRAAELAAYQILNRAVPVKINPIELLNEFVRDFGYDDVKDFYARRDRVLAKKSEAKYQSEQAKPNERKERIAGQEAVRRFRKFFSEEEIPVRVVERIMTPEGQRAVGMYANGIVKFVENPYASTPDHEALHAFFDVFTSKARKNDVLNEVKETMPDAVALEMARGVTEDVAAEEVLAEQFVQYVRGVENASWTQKITAFFRDMLEKFLEFFGKENKVRRLYKDILSGARPEDAALFSPFSEVALQRNKDLYAAQGVSLAALRGMVESGELQTPTFEILSVGEERAKSDIVLIAKPEAVDPLQNTDVQVHSVAPSLGVLSQRERANLSPEKLVKKMRAREGKFAPLFEATLARPATFNDIAGVLVSEDKAAEVREILKDTPVVVTTWNDKQGYFKGLARIESEQEVRFNVEDTVKNPLLEEAKNYETVDAFIEVVFNKKPEYGMSHRPNWEDMPRAHALTEGDAVPNDVYEHPEWSIASGRNINTDQAAKESWEALLSIKGKPDAEVTVYRATRKDQLNIGDWITFSKAYAEDSVEAPEQVYSFKVKASDVVFAGDDINEFGYYPRSILTDIWNEAHSGKFQMDEDAFNDEAAPDLYSAEEWDTLREMGFTEYAAVREELLTRFREFKDRISEEKAVNEQEVAELTQSLEYLLYEAQENAAFPDAEAEMRYSAFKNIVRSYPGVVRDNIGEDVEGLKAFLTGRRITRRAADGRILYDYVFDTVGDVSNTLFGDQQLGMTDDEFLDAMKDRFRKEQDIAARVRETKNLLREKTEPQRKAEKLRKIATSFIGRYSRGRAARSIRESVRSIYRPKRQLITVDERIALKQRFKELQKLGKEVRKLAREEILQELRKKQEMQQELLERINPLRKKSYTDSQVLKTVIKAKDQAARRARRDMAKEIGELRQEEAKLKQKITDYAKLLPLSERGKLLAMIRDARSQKDLARAFIRIDVMLEASEKKDLVGRIEKQMKRILDSPSMDIGYKHKLQELMDEYLVRGRSEKTLERLRKISEYVMAKEMSGEKYSVPEKVLEGLSDLVRKPLKELPVHDLENILEKFALINHFGRLKLEKRQQILEYEKERIRNAILPELTAIDKPDLAQPRIGQHLTAQEKAVNKARKITHARMHFGKAIRPMDVFFDMFSGSPGTYATNFYRMFKGRIDQSWGRYLDLRDEYQEVVRKIVEDLELRRPNFERIGAYAMLQQENGLEKLLQRGHTVEELRAIELTEKEMAAYQAMRDNMEKLYPAVKRHMQVLYNKDVGKVENYFPMLTDFEAMSEYDIWERFGENVPEITTNPKKNVIGGFTKERVDNAKQKVSLNALTVYMKHIDNVAYMLSMGETIKTLSEVAKHQSVRQAMGDYGSTILAEYLDTMARQGGMDKGVMNWMDNLRKNIAVATLGFKLSSVIVQPSSFADGAAMIGINYATSGMKQLATSSDVREFVIENMPELRDRVADDPAFRELANKGETWTDKFISMSMKPLQAVDGVVASSIAFGAYMKKMNELGLEVDLDNPNQEALDYAQLVVRRTQGSSSFKDLPPALTRGALTGSRSLDKTIFQFQTFVLNRWSFIAHDLPASMRRDKMAAANMLTWLTMASMYGVMAKEFTQLILASLFGGDDDDNEPFMNRLVGEIISTIPIISPLSSMMEYGSMPIPALNAVSRFTGGLKSATTGKSSDTRMKGIIRSASGVGTILGIPGTVQFADFLTRLIED